MDTVIIVGAGATLAEALPKNPSQAERPPLDGTFFEFCQAADLEGCHTLATYMKGEYGVDPFAESQSMEEIFNTVYADALSTDPPEGSLDAYWQLIKMYREAIRISTNPLDGRGRYGIGALLRFLARSNEHRDFTFITFNQDLLIEKALQEAIETKRYSQLPWALTTAYEMEFAGIGEVGFRGSKTFRATLPEGEEGRNPIQIFKLHGSMNWIHTVRSADDAKNSLRNPSGDLRCVNDANIYASLTYAGGERRQHVLPLIVPPIYEKSGYRREILADVWVEARNALVAADELIIFGYSFPQADVAARNAIRRAFFTNDKISHVHIIDISPRVGAEIGEMLDPDVVSRYQSVQAFSDHYASA